MYLYSSNFRRWLRRTRPGSLSMKDLALIERLEYLRLVRRKLRVYLADPHGRYTGLLALYAAFLQQYLPNLGLVLITPKKLPLSRKQAPVRGVYVAAPRVEGPFSSLKFAATSSWRSAADLREAPLRAGALLMIGADKYKPRHYLWASHLTDVRRALLPKLPNRPESFVIITGDPNPRRRTSFSYFYHEAEADPTGVWFALDPENNPLPVPLNPTARRNVMRWCVRRVAHANPRRRQRSLSLRPARLRASALIRPALHSMLGSPPHP